MKPGAIKPLKLLRRWRDHDWSSRLYFLAAFRYLLLAYWQFRTRSVAAILADLQATQPTARESAAFDWRKAAWAVDAAAAYVPWRSDCLVRAMAATRWLRGHGYRPAFHLGVAPQVGGQPSLKAHAWLSLHNEVIVGRGDEDAGAFAALVGADAPKTHPSK